MIKFLDELQHHPVWLGIIASIMSAVISGLVVGSILLFLSTAPRYDYIDDGTPDLLRFDKVKGELEACKEHYGGKWYKVASKSVVKVERPTITYNEFMNGRQNSIEVSK